MTNDRRIAIEKQIARATVQALIDATFTVTMNDGEDDTVIQSTNVKEIVGAMFTTDEDYLFAYDAITGKKIGMVYFVYGNDGYDVINDYSTSLERALASVNALAEDIERRAA